MNDNTIVIYKTNVQSRTGTTGVVSAAPYGLKEPTLESFKQKYGDMTWWNNYEFLLALPIMEAVALGYTEGMNEADRKAWAKTIMDSRQTTLPSGKKARKGYTPDSPVSPDDAMAAVREFCK